MNDWINNKILSGWKRGNPPRLTITPDYSEEWWERTDQLRPALSWAALLIDIVVVAVVAGILTICLLGVW